MTERLAAHPISELCDLIRPIMRRQMQEAIGSNELHYDTGEIVQRILANPDVVLRALGGGRATIGFVDEGGYPAILKLDTEQEFEGPHAFWGFPK